MLLSFCRPDVFVTTAAIVAPSFALLKDVSCEKKGESDVNDAGLYVESLELGEGWAVSPFLAVGYVFLRM